MTIYSNRYTKHSCRFELRDHLSVYIYNIHVYECIYVCIYKHQELSVGVYLTWTRPSLVNYFRANIIRCGVWSHETCTHAYTH